MYKVNWMNEWMNEWIQEWMNEVQNEFKNKLEWDLIKNGMNEWMIMDEWNETIWESIKKICLNMLNEWMNENWITIYLIYINLGTCHIYQFE